MVDKGQAGSGLPDIGVGDGLSRTGLRPGVEADGTEPQPAPSIVLVGTSFRSAPIAFRERAAKEHFGKDGLAAGTPGALESSVIETCNRVEMYLAASDPASAAESLLSRLGSDGYYVKIGVDAIAHIFRVASGLDSVVVGEDQILKQVRDAGRRARICGTAKSTLSPLFDAACSVGGHVRETYRAPSSRSLSSFALGYALGELGHRPKSVLLIGTGETAKLAALELDGAKIYLLSRRRDAGSRFASATRIRPKDLKRVAAECELIISATRHPRYVLRRKDVPDDRKRIILDLAFPRNVDPSLKSSRLVRLYDLDDLARAVGPTRTGPELEASEALIEAEAERFNRWLVATRLTPTLAGIYRWAEAIREDEVVLALRKLTDLSDKEKRVVEVMSRRLVSKLMAPHATFAKQKGSALEQPERLRLLNSIFGGDDS